ncbi:MAG: sulfotransferase [Alphaproteobacteria bacterium]|nr:sulfotransferase [Alphaproteobacteria bacterium]NCQ88441.1 sulfotransferase [Alphaproteobacteria bacterium]NCT05984.1 sulfotransferase [Alphaproteobacteria bacterium]
MPRNKPDFFIIGAPKCGTTTLYSWLKQHPGIFMPESKEPHYFAQNLSDRYCRIRSEESYLDLFKDAQARQICGEASVLYGFYPQSIQEILDFNPKAKFIFMLRHPIDMIISYHGQLLVNLEEDRKDFEVAWYLQDKRQKGQNIPPLSKDPQLLHYSQIGALGRHLNNIKNLVPHDQLLTILLDDMGADPQVEYLKVLNFLSFDTMCQIDFRRENEASAVRYIWLQRFIFSNNKILKILKSVIKLILPKKIRLSLNKTKRKKRSLNNNLHKDMLKQYEGDISILEVHFQKPLKSSYKEV